MIGLLSMLLVPAQAVKLSTVEVSVVNRSGEPVHTAAVVVDGEERRHVVDPDSGSWSSQASYKLDGSVQPFTRGLAVSGWVVAAGYEPTRFSMVVRGRVSKRKITLDAMSMDPGAVQLPQHHEARAVRVALSAASQALSNAQPRKAKARLNEAADAREQLQGPAYVQASVALLELRTLAALNAWDRRQQLALASPSEEVVRAEQISRDLTGDMALRWLAYARESGHPTERATAVCLLATGRPSRCD